MDVYPRDFYVVIIAFQVHAAVTSCYFVVLEVWIVDNLQTDCGVHFRPREILGDGFDHLYCTGVKYLEVVPLYYLCSQRSGHVCGEFSARLIHPVLEYFLIVNYKCTQLCFLLRIVQ